MRRLIVSLGAAWTLCGLGCQPPPMKTPAELGDEVDVFPISGRQGLLLFSPPIHFGPYSTTQLSRGVSRGEGHLEPGILSKSVRNQRHQISTFAIAGWRGSCDDYAYTKIEEDVVGLKVTSKDGAGLDERETGEQESGFACDLSGPSGHALHADLADAPATVRDEDGAAPYVIEPWTEGQGRGFLIQREGGEAMAAAQVDFDGYVHLPKRLPEAERPPVLALLVAILLR